jgi:CHASE2 domain-containing sensor protein
MLAWALSLGLVFGVLGVGELPEDLLRAARNHVNERPASGDIVLVGIDEKALREVGRWPWPRNRYAELITAIEAAKPRKQVHDILFSEKTDPAQDRALAAAIANSRDITLAYLPRAGAREGQLQDIGPLPEFADHARLATIGVWYNYANAAWLLPHAYRKDSRLIPSVASVLADEKPATNSDFRVNYAFAPKSVPVVSAADLISGKVDPARLKGKTVIVGTTSERLGDQFVIPGWGKDAGVYIHILGAETLKAGHPVDLGWLPAYLIAAIAAFVATRRKWLGQVASLGGALTALTVVPIFLERGQVFADVTPGYFVLIWASLGLVLNYARRRGRE